MRLQRKVVVGYWETTTFRPSWGLARAASAGTMHRGPLRRFGDNMREVAVTEGDSQRPNALATASRLRRRRLVRVVDEVSERDRRLLEEYYAAYASGRNYALAAAGIRRCARVRASRWPAPVLEAGGFKGFTTTFEELHGLAQLPALAFSG